MPKHRSIELHQQLMQAEAAERREAMDFYASNIKSQDDTIEALTTMRDARAARLNQLLDSLTRQVSETIASMRQNDAEMFDLLVSNAKITRNEMSQRLDELEGTDTEDSGQDDNAGRPEHDLQDAA